jgi:putative ABC transport system substrate-binding protein
MSMKRRQFITLLGGVATWPIAASAQQPKMPVIGYLSAGSPQSSAQRVRAFRQGLNEIGYVEGRNVAIDFRWSEDGTDQLGGMAADLVRRQVAVIVADGSAVSPAKVATATIPIVFFTATDPIASGFVASLNRPGGNLTGVTSLGVELGPKRLELLREIIPAATSFGFMFNRNATFDLVSDDRIAEVQAAARRLGLEVQVLPVASAGDFDAAFATLAKQRAAGLVINPNLLFSSHAEELARRALRQQMPAIFQFREFVAAGGLMSYGGNVTEPFHTIGAYAGRILKGEKPADLPVQQAAKIELIINMKTAKALGLTVPPTLLAVADEVIE